MSKKNFMLIFFSIAILLLLLPACQYFKNLAYGIDDLDEHLHKLVNQFRKNHYNQFKEIVPSSTSVFRSYNQHINPPLDSNKSISYWSSRFYDFRSFDRFEFSKNDTVQEGFYFVKEKQQMYYYKADWHYKPNRLSIKVLPYDTAHYALKVIHQKRTDLLDPNTKYLITTVRRIKKSQWDIKAWGYYQRQRYD
jgi:hypothetical protein